MTNEKDLLESIESGEWVSVPESDLLSYKNIAKTQIKKDQRISLRINASDLKSLQRKAFEEGIPYQTLITSILHKYLTGKIKEINV